MEENHTKRKKVGKEIFVKCVVGRAFFWKIKLQVAGWRYHTLFLEVGEFTQINAATYGAGGLFSSNAGELPGLKLQLAYYQQL